MSVQEKLFGTAAVMAARNPLVPKGAVAAESDTGVVKVGDGQTRYNSLPTALNGTYAQTLGTSSGGTGDATKVNAALAAAAALGVSTVKALPGQTYTIDAPIVLQSNVTLDISGSKWVRKSAYTGRMFTNRALTAIRTTATASISSSVNTTTLTDSTAAFTSADVGRSVTVAGAGLNGAFGASDLYTTIASVTNGTTAVLTDAAVVTVSSAALSIYTRDTNVGLIANAGTIIDAGNTSSAEIYINEIKRVDGLVLKGDGALCKTGTGGGGVVFWSVGDLTDFVWDHWRMNVTTGGVQPCGPLNRFSITRLLGYTGDDAVALQGSGYGWTGTNGTQGSISNGYIGNILLSEVSAGVAVKVFGGLTNANVGTVIDALTIECIYGASTFGHSGVLIESDRSGVTTIGNTVVRDVRWTSTTNSAHAPVTIQTTGGRNILVENVWMDGQSGSAGNIRAAVLVTGGTINELTVRGIKLHKSETYVALVALRASSLVNHLNLEDLHIHSQDNCNLLTLDANCQVNGVLNMSCIKHASSGNGVDAAGNIFEIDMTQVAFKGSGGGPTTKCIALYKASSTTAIRASSCNFERATYGIHLSSVSATILVSACSFGTVSVNNAFHADTTGTVRISSGGCDHSATTFMNTNVPWSVTGTDAKLDLNTSNLTPIAGDIAYNTNTTWTGGSGTSKAGMYGYDGSAWVKLFGPA